MTSSTFVLLSGCLTYGVPLALAARELLGLKPTSVGRDGPPPPHIVPPALRPLPDCLLPRPTICQADRILEDA